MSKFTPGNLIAKPIKATGQYKVTDGTRDWALVQTRELADKFSAALEMYEALAWLVAASHNVDAHNALQVVLIARERAIAALAKADGK